MKTLGEVRRGIERLRIKMEVFGAPPGFQKMFMEKFKGIGEAIIYENGVSPLTLSNLPNDTVLGNQSSEAFDSLIGWYKINEHEWVPQEEREAS